MPKQHRLGRKYDGKIWWPFATMSIGDWFQFPTESFRNEWEAQKSVSRKACQKGRFTGPGQFRTSRHGTYIRVERIRDPNNPMENQRCPTMQTIPTQRLLQS